MRYAVTVEKLGSNPARHLSPGSSQERKNSKKRKARRSLIPPVNLGVRPNGEAQN